MRILITNLTLAGRSGTETYIRDLAIGLLRRGHQPIVYSTQLGELADELRKHTVSVVDDLDRVAAPPDLIHGHHNVTTMTALLHFPMAPAIFVCHDRLSLMDAPPIFPRIRRYVAVDENCRDRLVLESGIPEDRVEIVHNWVDPERFRQRGALPAVPQKALIFTRYIDDMRLDVLRKTCESAQLTVDMMGTSEDNFSEHPEQTLGQYDIAFAKGRSALEAAAVGLAVVLAGYDRLGPMIRRSTVERLRHMNFGMRAIDRPIAPDHILQEIQCYDPADAAQVTRWIRGEATLEKGIDQWLALYDQVLQEHRRMPGLPERNPDQELRATARFLASLDVWSAQFEKQAHRLRQLKDELYRSLHAAPMPPLSVEDCRHISLQTYNVPERLASQSKLSIQLQVKNASNRALCSLPPNPVHMVARWMRNGTSHPPEGERERLSFPLLPQSTGIYTVHFSAPSDPGVYCLRITLVQENVRWFDSLGHEALWSDTTVLVE